MRNGDPIPLSRWLTLWDSVALFDSLSVPLTVSLSRILCLFQVSNAVRVRVRCVVVPGDIRVRARARVRAAPLRKAGPMPEGRCRHAGHLAAPCGCGTPGHDRRRLCCMPRLCCTTGDGYVARQVTAMLHA